ncbi:metal-dependent hydrolase [Methanolobus bombayensis]|uniref:metal-dependent hydrolase n=1 Tax=Methanolobus bombayensis TaxID=38023 RepID=UPI001AEB8A90|nr:metal-dependent hydrolase [Methanolobus bombayensis]MBP1910264.1 L-ascorbate metabolism protein UlaG (beta-lactamase superfamily) [Methanolobus bombayensis]
MENLVLTWLGHSCFQIDLEDITVLIDPFITGNPSATVRADELFPDIIAVTHGHSDHLGDTVEIAKRSGSKVVCIHELSQYLKSKNVKTEGMNIGGTVNIGNLSFTMTDARHSSSIDESGREIDGGKAAGFIIKADDRSIYHAGDTGLFGDMALISRLYKPDVAILPIGGRYTMGPEDAALAVKMLRPQIAIPMHYNTFDVISKDPNVFASHVKTMSNADVIIMEIDSPIIL